MIVVDTNVLAYLYLATGRSYQAERALLKDPDWVAPLLWRSEFRNALALYIRQGFLSLEVAQQIMDRVIKLMQGQEYEVSSFRVLSLVASSTCSAYDCEFVVLAQDLNVPLVTIDKQVLAQFPQVAISLDQFLAGDL
jgi:predicted nucleic acid-binding protein